MLNHDFIYYALFHTSAEWTGFRLELGKCEKGDFQKSRKYYEKTVQYRYSAMNI